jgi:hypothetical protein
MGKHTGARVDRVLKTAYGKIMEALRKIVDGNRLGNLFSLPKSFQDRKVEVIILPIAEVKAKPAMSKEDLDALFEGSVTQSLVGSIKLSAQELNDFSLDDMRKERLQKYAHFN